jgi:hypothetical protein
MYNIGEAFSKRLPELSGGLDLEDPKPRWNFKDSFICNLYSDKEKMAELCTSFSPSGEVFEPDDIEIATLENIFYTGRKNDFSCLAKNTYFKFFAHQSSACGNLPARELIYAGREYEDYIVQHLQRLYPDVSLNVSAKAIFGSKTIVLPTPQFICLTEDPDAEEFTEVCLADAFVDPVAGAKSLNLTMQIYSIKPGHNVEIMAKSPTLAAYSVFSSIVKEMIAMGSPKKKAVADGIRHCIANGYLSDYFAKHSSEVSRLFMEDLSLQEANAFIEVLRKDSQVKDAKIQEQGTMLQEQGTMLQEQGAMLQEQGERILELERELEMFRKGKSS